MSIHIGDLTKDEHVFLESWEEVYKKGILTFWVLFYLSQKEYDARSLYRELAKSDTSLNEHSMYRMLRRLFEVGLLENSHNEGRNKFYRISHKGTNILTAFTARNIAPLSQSLRSQE
jgi:DNA-binding PadR family transcriptional regulator